MVTVLTVNGDANLAARGRTHEATITLPIANPLTLVY